jgi:hypothetical protein
VVLLLQADARLELTGAAVFVQRRDTGEIPQAATADARCAA